jgi:hypothetical protein
VRAADIGGTNVVAKSIKQTTLYTDLNGDAGQQMLVTRDDLRKLAMTASEELFTDTRGVRTARCSTNFVNDILNHFKDQITIETGTFTAEMLKRSYNPHDIDPDEVTKTFDRNISSSSTKDQVNISTGGGVNIFGIGANGNMSGNYFTERAESHDVQAEWNGTKWIAKSLKVLQVNVSDFAANYHASCSDFSVGTAEALASKPYQMNFIPDNWQVAVSAKSQNIQ